MLQLLRRRRVQVRHVRRALRRLHRHLFTATFLPSLSQRARRRRVLPSRPSSRRRRRDGAVRRPGLPSAHSQPSARRPRLSSARARPDRRRRRRASLTRDPRRDDRDARRHFVFSRRFTKPPRVSRSRFSSRPPRARARALGVGARARRATERAVRARRAASGAFDASAS